jgi:hypothetical protein
VVVVNYFMNQINVLPAVKVATGRGVGIVGVNGREFICPTRDSSRIWGQQGRVTANGGAGRAAEGVSLVGRSPTLATT